MQLQASDDLPSDTGPEPAAPAGREPPITQVDIVYCRDRRLLVYGWVLGLSTDIARAELVGADWTFDIAAQAARTARPDVAAHFSGHPQAASGGDHGFYALFDLPAGAVLGDQLSLLVTDHGGLVSERRVDIARLGEQAETGMLQSHLETLNLLLPRLAADEVERLVEFSGSALPIGGAAPPGADELDPPVRFVADLCCVLEERLLIVVGWILDPFGELSDLGVEFRSQRFDLRQCSVGTSRPDLAGTLEAYRGLGSAADPGFLFAAALPRQRPAPGAVSFTMRRGGAQVRMTRPVVTDARQARREFLSVVGTSSCEAVESMCDHLERLLGPSRGEQELRASLEGQRIAAAVRLPECLDGREPRHALFIDHAIPVADRGVFVAGWFAAEPSVARTMRLILRCGAESFDLGANWARCPRPDVSAHLRQMSIGSTGDDHGFFCFVPLPAGRSPCVISLECDGSAPRQMRVRVAPPPESAIHAIRSILCTFNGRHPDLLEVMNRNIGPAVSAAWAGRRRDPVKPVVERFGPAPAEPAVSVIVPLYGRHDFAEYQLALFADDPDFQSAELIYVVDDPSLYEEFRSLCAGLYGMYRVPFTVVYPRVNLGFAGANNCAAGIARGTHLLLMNSDVMPKQPGWVAAMRESYGRTPGIGVLGVKLTYENGSVQHAGMEFRRSPVWANMWINYHPYKGQSAVGLGGLRQVEAVTAACVLVEADLYRRLGGLSEDYIVGDFEDSDLCLKAAAAGRRSYVALDIELHHLERQSQNRIGDGVFRTNLSIYNCWQHHRRWSETIETLYK